MKILGALIGTILMVGAAYADPPKSPKIEQTTKASATVTKLDVAKRHLTIRNDAGDEYTIDVDPAVRNLEQLKVGDKIVVTYYQSVAASLGKAGESTGVAGTVEADTAKAGERPGGTARSTTRIPVTIVSVDTQKNVVKFRGDDDLVRSTDVVSPEGKAFIKTLKSGDKVMLTYTESVAVSVDPTK
jgi:hypothetical protein